MKRKFLKSILGIVVASTMVSSVVPVFAEELPVEVIEESVEFTEEEPLEEEPVEEVVEDVSSEQILDAVNEDIVANVITDQIAESLEEEPLEEEPVEEVVEEDPEVETVQIGVRVPEGFAVEFGYQASYKHTYIPESVDQNNVWVFNIQNDKGKDVASGNFFYRVYSVEENNDAVTYWGWLTAAEFKSAKGSIIEVTPEMLNLTVVDENGEIENPENRDADTVDEYLTNNQYDTQDILITGNADGYINLAVGSTWTLDCYRMWEIIESFMNAQISQPDFHIEVMNVNGEETDIIDITKNTGDGSANTITALKEGTVILKITYDAVTVDGAMGGETFSAIAPENTALFVVQVGQEASVDDGINLDSEVDVQYYTGDNGAVIVSTPGEGSKVAISRCAYVDGKLVLTKFIDSEDESSGITKNEDGSFNIVGLTEGSSVVRVTDEEGNTAYQVVKSKQINFAVKDENGEQIDVSDHEFVPGESVSVVADKFYDVFMKSSGVYNGSAALQFTLTYTTVDGETKEATFSAKENAQGFAITYTQAGDPVYRTVPVVIPEDWDGESDLAFDCNVYRNTRFGLKLTGHRTVYKNTGETKVNGYVIEYSSATVTTDALDADSFVEVMSNEDITPEYNIPIGTEILTGTVYACDSSKVEYKNVEEN